MISVSSKFNFLCSGSDVLIQWSPLGVGFQSDFLETSIFVFILFLIPLALTQSNTAYLLLRVGLLFSSNLNVAMFPNFDIYCKDSNFTGNFIFLSYAICCISMEKTTGNLLAEILYSIAFNYILTLSLDDVIS